MTKALVKILRIIDSDNRSSMGYLYNVIHYVMEKIWRRYQNIKIWVQPFIIIDI